MDKTNKILTLDNNEKYIIVKQFNEIDGVFYLAGEVTKDETDLTGKFKVFKHVQKGDEFFLEEVTDEERLKKFNIEEE